MINGYLDLKYWMVKLKSMIIMEKIKEVSFRKNGLPYTFIMRGEVAVIFGVGGTFTDKILHYEVCEIHERQVCVFHGVSFPHSEVLPSNEQFGKDKSRAIMGYDNALAYFHQITEEIKSRAEGKNRFIVED